MKNATQSGNTELRVRRTTAVWAALCLLSLPLFGCAGVFASEIVDMAPVRQIAKADGASIAAAIAIREASACMERGAPDEAAAWLDGVLEYREDLLDDGLFRALTARLSADSLSPPLRAVRSAELARRELMEQNVELARQFASAARAIPEARVLTKSRAEMVMLFVRSKRDVDPGAEAYAAEVSRVRRRPIPGRLGANLKLRLTMLEAAVHQENDRYQEAIALYLSIPMGSGMYRPARLGLAWCQFQIGHAQRSLKILALLPGGLSGDPERAVLAAMAAHALGKIDAARAIVAEALSRRPDLEAETVDSEQVLSAIASGEVRPLLRGPLEGLTLMVASSAGVLSTANALLEYRGHPMAQSPCEYGDALAELLTTYVEAETEHQLKRLQKAWETLERLAPQIR